MSTTIQNTYIAEFNQYLRHLASQTYSRLDGTVETVSCGGETYSFDLVGNKEATPKINRAQPTPVTDYPFSRRTAEVRTFNCGELIEFEDQIQAKVSIQGGLVKEMAASMARAKDEEIIRAFGADAMGEGGTMIPFPDGDGPTGLNQIVGDGTAPISFDFVTEVQEKFLENDLQGEVRKYFVISPKQVRKLLQLTEQTSSDFVTREALQKLNAGLIVPNWLGFTWICSTLLQSPNSGEIDCWAYTDRAIGMAMNRDATTFMQQDPSRSYAYSLYTQATYGAVRVQDRHIVRCHLADTL